MFSYYPNTCYGRNSTTHRIWLKFEYMRSRANCLLQDYVPLVNFANQMNLTAGLLFQYPAESLYLKLATAAFKTGKPEMKCC